MKKTFLFLAGLALFSACSKEKTVEVIKEVPTARATINIAQPVAGATFQQGDTVRIIGTLSAPATLHGYTVTIRNESDHGKEVFFCHWHAHAKNLTVDTVWINTLSGTSDMSLKIDAVIDHGGNSEGKAVPFKTTP